MPSAKESFAAPDGRMVARGEVVAEDDPVIAGREGLFDWGDTPVEQATAAPGERRATRRTTAGT